MTLRVAVPDLISPSYFPAIAAVELGFFEEEGLDAAIELIFPIARTYEELAAGNIDYVAGTAHATLYVFEEWRGCKLVAALSQGMYWFLVVRSDLDVQRGDLSALVGLRIGAAPGPVDGLVRMLEEAGIDPSSDVVIAPVAGTDETGVSFGVAAAKNLEEAKIDGFWANGMGAEVAVRRQVGKLLVDARRGDGPNGAEHYTFPALVATETRIESDPDQVGAAVRAVALAQRVLRDDPSRATKAAQKAGYPEFEASLIAELIERDTPFYDPAIPERKVTSMNRFAADLGLLSGTEIPYEQVVATRFREDWVP